MPEHRPRNWSAYLSNLTDRRINAAITVAGYCLAKHRDGLHHAPELISGEAKLVRRFDRLGRLARAALAEVRNRKDPHA